MTAKKLLLFCVMFLCQMLCAQDSIVLKEVIISDFQLTNFSNSHSVTTFNDSIIDRNHASLTSLLNYNTPIYFKENGFGMVSSPSFRGTTAQQTAVIWNGININSQLVGQTDFNTITTRDFNSISVRAGGGSVVYGSSAIGGSIHLNNELEFKKQFVNELRLNYGSFNTLGANYKILASNKKTSVQLSVSRNSSDNDYEYIGYNDKQNDNGQFYNTSINASFGYKINRSNIIKVYSQIFESERHMSATVSAPSKSRYDDLNSRNLLEWSVYSSKIISTVKLALLNEQFKYFEDAEAQQFESAKAETFIAKYDINYRITRRIDINAIVDYTQTSGSGENIGNNTRKIGTGALLFKHHILKKLQYEFSLRKEITDDYQSPMLYGFGTTWNALSNYNVKLNVSRNFRIPTFNDLYYHGSGNTDLKSESSIQAEIGQEYKWRNVTVSATGYWMQIENLLRWKPSGNSWKPENVGDVECYGVEGNLHYIKRFGANAFIINSVYAYTVSINTETEKQLAYVPYHKLTGDLAYSFKAMTFTYQYLFNGEVYLLADNTDLLSAYQVSNAGLDYRFGKGNSYAIGFQALNIWNEPYQSVSKRPMPGRNYVINLNLKF